MATPLLKKSYFSWVHWEPISIFYYSNLDPVSCSKLRIEAKPRSWPWAELGYVNGNVFPPKSSHKISLPIYNCKSFLFVTTLPCHDDVHNPFHKHGLRNHTCSRVCDDNLCDDDSRCDDHIHDHDDDHIHDDHMSLMMQPLTPMQTT